MPSSEVTKAGAAAKVRGMRGKFVQFLQGEAERRRRSLLDVTRRREEEPGEELSRQAVLMKDELDELEELLQDARGALDKDRGASPARPPAHWRPRARRAMVHSSRSGSCGAPSTIHAPRKMGCKPLSAAYCDKVERRVLPMLRPIDRALAKISRIVHGPPLSTADLQREQDIQQQMREQLQGEHERKLHSPDASSPPTTRPQESAARRKEIVREFWAMMSCGACSPPDPSAKGELSARYHTEVRSWLEADAPGQQSLSTGFFGDVSTSGEGCACLEIEPASAEASQLLLVGEQSRTAAEVAHDEAAVVVPVSSLQVERAVATCVRDMLETACRADLTLRSDEAAATASTTGAPERLPLTCVDAPPPALDAETTSSSETVLSPVSAFFSRMRVMDDGVAQELLVQKVV